MADNADRRWMYTGRKGKKEISPEWFNKLEELLDQAFVDGSGAAWCPCSRCNNNRLHSRDDIGLHLVEWV